MFLFIPFLEQVCFSALQFVITSFKRSTGFGYCYHGVCLDIVWDFNELVNGDNHKESL